MYDVWKMSVGFVVDVYRISVGFVWFVHDLYYDLFSQLLQAIIDFVV